MVRTMTSYFVSHFLVKFPHLHSSIIRSTQLKSASPHSLSPRHIPPTASQISSMGPPTVTKGNSSTATATMMPGELLTVDAMWSALHGGSILGSGGGGLFSEGAMYMHRIQARTHGCVHDVHLIPISKLADTSYVACPYLLGALIDVADPNSTSTASEKNADQLTEINNHIDNNNDSIVRGLRTAMKMHPVKALVPIEMGVSNLAVAFYLSAVTGLPVVDGDPTGRSVPLCTQSTFALHGVDVGVTIATTDVKGKDETFVLHGLQTDERAEEVLRALCSASGNSVSVVDHVLPVAKVKNTLIAGTVSQARRLGEAWQEEQRKVTNSGSNVADVNKMHKGKQGLSTAEKIAQAGNGKVLLRGVVTCSESRDEDGFSKGQVTIAVQAEKDEKRTVQVEFVNESMCVKDVTNSDGDEANVLVCIPEIIVLVEVSSGEVLLHPEVKCEAEVVVIVLPAPAPFLTPAGLGVLGPKYIGFRGPFKSALD